MASELEPSAVHTHMCVRACAVCVRVCAVCVRVCGINKRVCVRGMQVLCLLNM